MRTMLPRLLLTLLCPAVAAADYCAFETRVERDVDAAALTALEIDALAGELIARGSDGDRVEVDARLCSDREETLGQMQLELTVEGTIGRVIAVIPEEVRIGWTTQYAYIDIDLSVPRGLPIRVRDSSGDMQLVDVTVTSIDDSSGAITLRDTRGNLTLSDSSGEISLRRHEGDLEVSDSSGDMRIEELTGKLHVEHDSSGDMDFTGVTGEIEIDRDSSGGIYITDVKGSVNIDRDGSGGIEISQVRDDVRIGSDGSGEVRVSQVGGDFTVEIKGSGEIRFRDIAGSVATP